MVKTIGGKEWMFILVLVVVMGLFFANGYTIAPITSKQLSFSANVGSDSAHTLTQGTVLATKVTPGYFKFAAGCEEIKIVGASFDISCAQKQFTDAGYYVDASDVRNSKPGSVVVNNNCITYGLSVDGKDIVVKSGETVRREGYSILLDGNVKWTYGTEKKLREPGACENGCAAPYYYVMMAYQTGGSINAVVTLDQDALTVNFGNTTQLNFVKKLPVCVQTGVAISDSPRILGATVIDNKDGTFTNVGNVQQSEVNFPNAKSGSASYVPAQQLGFHTVVVKPWIIANNNKIDFLPELSETTKRTGVSSQEWTPISVVEQQQLPAPTFWQKVQAWFKRLFRVD